MNPFTCAHCGQPAEVHDNRCARCGQLVVLPTTEDCPPGPLPAPPADFGRSAAVVSSPDEELSPPRLPSIPGYDILGELGRGGMGVVYRARQVRAGRLVALKMIRSGSSADAHELIRFRIEAEAVARLQHSGIVQIFEVGEHEGLPFFSLELCPEGSLAGKLESGPLQPAAAAALVEQLADAMQAAHRRNIVHRDLKPANVLLAEDGSPRITDFGLAKHLDVEQGQTASGAVMGTPSYMAPEQALGLAKEVGPAADTYALGAILYECLTGRPPFLAPTHVDTLMQVVKDDPVSPRRLRPELPRDLETICLKCLDKDPGRRYVSALALADDLRRFRAGQPVLARPLGPAERFFKWAGRRPATATACALALLATVLGSGGGLATWQWRRAEGEWRRAESEKRDADQSRLLAEQALGRAEQARRAADQSRALAVEARQRAEFEKGRAEIARQNEASAREDLAYVSALFRVDLAHRAWLDNDLARAEQLLDGCPERYRCWDWRHVHHLCHQDLLTLAHDSPVLLAGYLTNGERLISVAADGNVRVWDPVSGRAKTRFRQDCGPVYLAVLGMEGKRLALVARDHSVEVWDPAAGKLLGRLAGHAKKVQSLAFSPNGQRLATSSADMTVRIWDIVTGRTCATVNSAHYHLPSLSFRPDGTRVVLAELNSARVVNPKTGAKLQTVQGKPHVCHFAAYSPDGKSLLIAWGGYYLYAEKKSYPSEIHVLDAETGQKRFVMGYAGNYPRHAFSRDGNLLAMPVEVGDTVEVWDLSAGRRVHSLVGHAGVADSLCFSDDGSQLATGSADRTARVWDLKTGQEVRTLKGHPAGLRTVSFSPDRRCLATVGMENAVKVWDLTRRPDEPFLKVEKGSINCLRFSPNSELLAVGRGGFDSPGIITIRKVGTREDVQTLKGHLRGVQGLGFSPDGNRLASAAMDGTVRVWDLAAGKQLQQMPQGLSWAHGVAFSPDGQRLAASYSDGTVVIWQNGTKLWAVKEGNRTDCVAFSPDGKRLVNGQSSQVVIRDADTGKVLQTLAGHSNVVRSVAYSPDGRSLVSVALDGKVKLWDARTGKEIQTMRGTQSVAFSPNGRRLISDVSEAVVVWDVKTGLEVLTLREPKENIQSMVAGTDVRKGALCSVVFSPDGRRIASASWAGTVRVWESSPAGPAPGD